MIDLHSKANWCLSGGADGADLMWGMSASELKHGVIHFSFDGHKTEAPPNELYMLTRADLASADYHCHLANKTLRRRFPTKSSMGTNLLRRDWFQVEGAESCYAVSTFGLPFGPTIPLGTVLSEVQVQGGTAWTVEMFINCHRREACACYFFDQILCHWFQWVGNGWECVYHPPQPSGIYAGIGTRDLLPMGGTAIRVLMEQNVRATSG